MAWRPQSVGELAACIKDERQLMPARRAFKGALWPARLVSSAYHVDGAKHVTQCALCAHRAGRPGEWQPVRLSPLAQQTPRRNAPAVVSPLRLDEALADAQSTSVWQRRSSRQLICGILKQVRQCMCTCIQHIVASNSLPILYRTSLTVVGSSYADCNRESALPLTSSLDSCPALTLSAPDGAGAVRGRRSQVHVFAAACGRCQENGST